MWEEDAVMKKLPNSLVGIDEKIYEKVRVSTAAAPK